MNKCLRPTLKEPHSYFCNSGEFYYDEINGLKVGCSKLASANAAAMLYFPSRWSVHVITEQEMSVNPPSFYFPYLNTEIFTIGSTVSLCHGFDEFIVWSITLYLYWRCKSILTLSTTSMYLHQVVNICSASWYFCWISTDIKLGLWCTAHSSIAFQTVRVAGSIILLVVSLMTLWFPVQLC